ncbi:hypothetical protein FHW19_004504 [Ochrobactrum anthropi]|nr:hypothetical protein [Brucella anthropi]
MQRPEEEYELEGGFSLSKPQYYVILLCLVLAILILSGAVIQYILLVVR